MRQRAGSRAQIVDDRRPPKQKGSHGLRHGRAKPNAVDGVARKGAGESQGGGMTFRLRWKREEHVKVGESTPTAREHKEAQERDPQGGVQKVAYEPYAKRDRTADASFPAASPRLKA